MRNRGNMLAMFLLLFAGACVSASAQKHDYVWVFGDGAGLDFNPSDRPRAFETERPGFELIGIGSPCVADSSGRLQFYLGYTGNRVADSRGVLYNGQGRRVPGGDTLFANPQAENCFLPMAGGRFQLITLAIQPAPPDTTGSFPFNVSFGLWRHVLDTANGGRVVRGNELVYNGPPLALSFRLIRHADGVRWWLLAHEMKSDRFVKFIFSDDNVEGPFFQSAGRGPTVQDLSNFQFYDYGVVSSSSSGSLVVGNSSDLNLTEVFAFDRCSGDLDLQHSIRRANESISDLGYTLGGLSPSGQFLYTSSFDSLFQFDLRAADVLGSRTLLWSSPSFPEQGVVDFQMGPDNRLYVGNTYVAGVTLPDAVRYVHAINAPEVAGIGSDFEYNAVDLGRKSAHTLPGFPNYRLGPLIGPVARAGNDTTICRGDRIQLGAPPVRPGLLYNWAPPDGLDDPASPQPQAAPDATTTYTLTVTDPNFGTTPPCNQAVAFAAVKVNPAPAPPPLPQEVRFCDTLTLDAGPGANWPGFSESSLLRATEPGLYRARIENEYGCAAESETRLVDDCPYMELVVPNVFSPNGDGANDELNVSGANFKAFSLRVFDRWGREVFSTTNPLEGWNGTADGLLAPEGVYYYALRATGPEGREVRKTGAVTLLR